MEEGHKIEKTQQEEIQIVERWMRKCSSMTKTIQRVEELEKANSDLTINLEDAQKKLFDKNEAMNVSFEKNKKLEETITEMENTEKRLKNNLEN